MGTLVPTSRHRNSCAEVFIPALMQTKGPRWQPPARESRLRRLQRKAGLAQQPRTCQYSRGPPHREGCRSGAESPPVLPAVKTPLGWLVAVGLGLATWWGKRGQLAYWMPVAFAAGILLPGMTSHVNIGLRHIDRKSTRLNSSHLGISYAVFCL